MTSNFYVSFYLIIHNYRDRLKNVDYKKVCVLVPQKLIYNDVRVGIQWCKCFYTAQRWSRMRKLFDIKTKINRNTVHICIYLILHCMGPETSHFAKEFGLCWTRPCWQASPANYDVTCFRNGDRF